MFVVVLLCWGGGWINLCPSTHGADSQSAPYFPYLPTTLKPAVTLGMVEMHVHMQPTPFEYHFHNSTGIAAGITYLHSKAFSACTLSSTETRTTKLLLLNPRRMFVTRRLAGSASVDCAHPISTLLIWRCNGSNCPPPPSRRGSPPNGQLDVWIFGRPTRASFIIASPGQPKSGIDIMEHGHRDP